MTELPTRFDYSDVQFSKLDLHNGGTTTLYVIESQPYVKIGLARDPAKRFMNLFCSSPHPLSFVVGYWIPLACAPRAEAFCHSKLMPYHHRGEWFTASLALARKVVWTVASRAVSAHGYAKPGAADADAINAAAVGKAPPSQRMMQRINGKDRPHLDGADIEIPLGSIR